MILSGLATGCREPSPLPTPPSPTPLENTKTALRKTAPTVPEHAGTLPSELDPGPMPGPCGNLPLLEAYWRAGVLKFPSPMAATVHLVFNLHSADCGAPDDYGHYVDLELILAKGPNGCLISGASSVSDPWGQPGKHAWKNKWMVHGATILTSAGLQRIVLRDASKRHALELRRYGHFFYENVIPGASLRGRLRNEEDDSHQCCFGYSSSKTRDWRWRFGPRNDSAQ